MAADLMKHLGKSRPKRFQPRPYYGPAPVYIEPPVYGPPPMYVEPPCYWTRGEPMWDGYRGIWVQPSVRVCQ